ncbi:MAG: prolipoprotein diacylglyceryl transferase [Alphaproteobacteria bacterium]
MFPSIDPVIFQIYGPIALRWYNLAYMLGLGGGLFYCRYLIKTFPELCITKKHLDDFLSWAVVSIVVGGRLGEILFYPDPLLSNDIWQIFRVWEGGMSFHGGVLGLLAGLYLFSVKYKISIFNLGDCITAAAPLGLFFGRIANFINDELYGTITAVPWAIAFPSGEYLPRHPSQLYEAFLEGVLLFYVLYIAYFKFHLFRKPGLISGLFLIGYGSARFVVEFFREPDGMFLSLTTGQALCIPMFLGGIFLLTRKPKSI